MHRSPRHRRPFATAGAAMILAACGGGGGDEHAPAERPPAADTPATAPLTTSPASSHTGAGLAAFERINAARLAAGVGAVRQNPALDAAAQAHASYQVTNYTTGHGETEGKPGFTGGDPETRAAAQGYAGAFAGEVISHRNPGVESVDSLLLTVYHLFGLLYPVANEVGIGIATTRVPGPLNSTSITFGTTDTRLRPIRAAWHWPPAGQAGVAPAFDPASESPNPAPDLPATGTPIMFCAAQDGYAAPTVHRARLEEVGTGAPVALRLLRHEETRIDDAVDAEVVNDPHLAADVFRPCVFLLPRAVLKARTTYRVHMRATQSGKAVEAAWSFTTR